MRGKGVYVWDEEGRRYLDFTAGWGVASLGHAPPVILEALTRQAQAILQTPNASLTYSPVRAQLLALMAEILPAGLSRIFFCTSGSEANDAAIKLARKVTGRLEIIAAQGGFHGRMTTSASATALIGDRMQVDPLSTHYRFVPYGDVAALDAALDEHVAALLLEPIQGEGGVIVPPVGYLAAAASLCQERHILLIMDEVQTGFCRTGPLFASAPLGPAISFLSLGKGIAGGFPLAALAMTEEVALKLQPGDHGGTYLGNPLGCAVALAVIGYLRQHHISEYVSALGDELLNILKGLQQTYPFLIRDVRCRGLMAGIDVGSAEVATALQRAALQFGLIINVTQGVVRLLPPLTVTRAELLEGMAMLEEALVAAGVDSCDGP